MTKVSVIIPTIYKKPKVLHKLIDLLNTDECVSEILIINNSKKQLKSFSSKKILVYNSEKNLYVNASWNLGIKMIKEDLFLIINDDILVCKNLCSLVVNSGIFDEEKTGLVGLNDSEITSYNRSENEDIPLPESTSVIKFRKLIRPDNLGCWGSAIFGKKQNFYFIPEDLKIIFGDNLLVLNNIRNNKYNYIIVNSKCNHITSSSSSDPEFYEIIKSDIENFKKYV